MQRPIACRRFTRLDTFAATVTQRFVNRVFVVVVIRIFFVDFSDYPPLQRILWTRRAGREPFFIRLAGDIEISGTQLAITALRKLIHGFDGGMAQNARGAAQVAGGAF